MWNTRRQEETTKYGAAPVLEPTLSASSLETEKDPTLMPNILAADAKPDSPAGGATIGKGVKFVGQIYSNEDLFVDGDFEGTVEAIAHRLTIGTNANVHASVKAHDVVVLGTLEGNLEVADRIEIAKNAKIVGDIRTARIHIEDGAYFKGSVDIVMPEALKAQGKSQPAVLTTALNPAGVAVGEPTRQRQGFVN